VSHKPFEGGHTVDVESTIEEPVAEENYFTGYAIVAIDEQDFNGGNDNKESYSLLLDDDKEEIFLVRK